jgi:hypothetical protein
MPFLFSAVSSSAKACVCRPASEAYSAHAPVAAEPGDFPLADEFAAAQPAEGSAAAEQVRSWAAERVHCVAEDYSSPDAADSAPDGSAAEYSARPWDARCAQAALQADSCPDGC